MVRGTACCKINACDRKKNGQLASSASVADPDLGSGIRCFFDHRDPGSEMVKKSRSGSGIRIRDEQPGSYFRELRNNFFNVKILKFFMRIRDGKNLDPGSGMEKFGSGIRGGKNSDPG
jgi:hypothetical protein